MKPVDKVLFQIFQIFRETPLAMADGLLISLQLLAWAALSERGALASEDQIKGRDNLTPAELNQIWDRLGTRLGEHGKGFSGWKVPDWVSPQVLGAAVKICQRAVDTGVMPGLSLTDAVAIMDTSKGVFWALPPAIADLIVALARVQQGESVYLPWDGTGQFLGRVGESAREVHLEAMRASPLPYLIGLLQPGANTIQVTDPITEPGAVEAGALRSFDVVISFPPIGMKYTAAQVADDWYRRFPEKTQSGTVLAVRHVLAQTKHRAVVAVPNSLLFSSGAEKALRQSLLEDRCLEAVITLPSGLLSWSNIAFSLLVLNKSRQCDRVRFVDARAEEFRESDKLLGRFLIKSDELLGLVQGQEESEFAATVSVAEILANDAQLQPGRYALPQSQRRLEEWCRKTEVMPLGDIVETIRPMPTSDSTDGILAYEVGVSDLPEYGLIQRPTKLVRVEPSAAKKAPHQFLRSGDIVLIIKGSVGRVGIVGEVFTKEGLGGWVAGQSAIVLRTKSGDSRYLAAFLRSKIGQALMARLVSGATIPLLKLVDLLRLSIPVPSRELQDKVIADFEREVELQSQIEQLRRQQSELADQHWALS